jgi:hypothetical protein
VYTAADALYLVTKGSARFFSALHTDIILRMSVHLVIESLRMIARAMMQPGSNLDLYFNDRYVVISKRVAVAGILAVILIPVLLVAALLFGLMHG